MFTKKIYYEDAELSSIKAKIIEINKEGIIFNQTIAFPEGGGQIGDCGQIINLTKEGNISFSNTTKIPGKLIYLDDFPTITVENKIVHHVESSNQYEVGDECQITIDIERRRKIAKCHSAIHIGLMAVEKLRGESYRNRIYGAKITDEYGRLDFKVDKRFSPEDIVLLNQYVNDIVNKNIPIEIFSHELEKEALYWKCGDYIIPCGGLHVNNTGCLKHIKVSRKNAGKNAERIITTIGDENND